MTMNRIRVTSLLQVCRMRFIGCQKLTFSDAIKTDVSEVKSKMEYVYILPSYMYITRGNVMCYQTLPS